MTTRMRGLVLAGGILLLASCAREAGPEDVALEYARSLYAGDAAKAYRLLSAQDRRGKDEATFLRERSRATGFALELAGRLASFIEATPVKRASEGAHVTVTLKLRLPDANAPPIATLVHQWDERRLNAFSRAAQWRILKELDRLYRTRALAALEGEETFELVREGSGWRVFLNWTGGVSVQFHATVNEGIPLQVTINPDEVLVNPGERVQVNVRVKNLHTRDVIARVGHRIEPKSRAEFLAMLQCPMFLPVTLAPGQTKEFLSEYLVLKDLPERARRLHVTYEFVMAQ